MDPLPVRPRAVAQLVVAIDGPAGSGKSTVARAVAERLGLRYLDTGAMYRAITWLALERGIEPADEDGVAALADAVVLAVGTDPRSPAVSIDGIDVGGELRSGPVTGAVSHVAAVARVRRQLVGLQRALIGTGGIVVEGRDIGSVVAPTADVKVYLTAVPEVRADRRARETAGAAGATAGPSTQADLTRRDRLDTTRAADPLVRVADAVELDTTHLPVERVVEAVLELCREAAPTAPGTPGAAR